MPQRHCGVKMQAGCQDPGQCPKYGLYQECNHLSPDTRLIQPPDDFRPAGELLENHLKIGMGEVQGHQRHDQENEQAGREEPDQRHDQLGPDQLMHAHRQRKHQIALILQQIPVEAAHHDHKGHHHRCDHGSAEEEDDQGKENFQHRNIRQISRKPPDR